MSEIYNSNYTGLQVDNAIRDKVETVSQAQFRLLDPVSTPTAKIYIITDGSDVDTMWRSNGTKMVQLSGGGGGGGGGSTPVTPITTDNIPAGSQRLFGMTVSGSTYRITNISLSSTTSTDVTLIIK